jgi:glycosyltransferase involved in cell wall biosynthesis
MVWKKVPDTHFVFIGPPVGSSEAEFRRYQDARIVRLGAVDLQTKSDALAACDLLCVPSTQESFGGVYTEAWCLGKPVIGCDIPAVAEVIEEGVDGYLVEQNPDPIAGRILELLMDDKRRREMGAMGREKVALKYSWEQLARRTERVYESLLS